MATRLNTQQRKICCQLFYHCRHAINLFPDEFHASQNSENLCILSTDFGAKISWDFSDILWIFSLAVSQVNWQELSQNILNSSTIVCFLKPLDFLARIAACNLLMTLSILFFKLNKSGIDELFYSISVDRIEVYQLNYYFQYWYSKVTMLTSVCWTLLKLACNSDFGFVNFDWDSYSDFMICCVCSRHLFEYRHVFLVTFDILI